MENNRQVKGIWIPIEIWECKDLSWNEKILFAEIDSYTSKDKDCYISNEYIANLLGVAETSANKILSSLIQKGYVIKTAFDGRRRFVKSALHIEARQGCSLEQGRVVVSGNILLEDTGIDYYKKESKEDKSSFKKDADFLDDLPKEDKPKRQPKAIKQSNWRGDYDEYKAIVDNVCDELMKDEKRKKRVLQLYPSADYERTVIKWYQYWGSEQGWNNKKKGTSNSINMFNTFDKTYTYSIVNVNNAIPSPPPRKEVIPDGEWADGTYVLNGYRYYNSPKTGQRTSVAMNAPIRPNEWAEYDYRNNNWITPIEHDNGIFW